MRPIPLTALALIAIAAFSSCTQTVRTPFRGSSIPFSLIPESNPATNVHVIHHRSKANVTETNVLYLGSASPVHHPLSQDYPRLPEEVRMKLRGGVDPLTPKKSLPFREGERVFYALQPDFSLKEIPLPKEVARTLLVHAVFSSEESDAIYKEVIIPQLFKFR